MYGYYYFDPTYLLLVIGMVLSLLASAKVNSIIPTVNNGRMEKISPARNSGQESVEPRFATGTIAERRFNGI